MPFIVEQIQPPPSVGSSEPMDPMVGYLLLFFAVCYLFRGLIVGTLFFVIKLSLLFVFGFFTYKLFL
jgi:hypothetical protein